uniref:Uncharacterized protein n=1 Tax=Anopheles atroparvus TaxID=41427 RepID=A0A182IT60_ANOAO
MARSWMAILSNAVIDHTLVPVLLLLLLLLLLVRSCTRVFAASSLRWEMGPIAIRNITIGFPHPIAGPQTDGRPSHNGPPLCRVNPNRNANDVVRVQPRILPFTKRVGRDSEEGNEENSNEVKFGGSQCSQLVPYGVSTISSPPFELGNNMATLKVHHQIEDDAIGCTVGG